MEDAIKVVAEEFEEYADADNPYEVVERCSAETCIRPDLCATKAGKKCDARDHRHTYIRKEKRDGSWSFLRKDESVFVCFGCKVAFAIPDMSDAIPMAACTSPDGLIENITLHCYPFMCTICMRSFIGHLAEGAVNEALLNIENGKSHREEQEKNKKRKK